jgi:tRNA threonylcarbamoyladenosine biosynthesis protein TsaE
MGTGKTTLIHALCEVLGVTKTVNSPTFAIIQEYLSPVAGVIYHMDWYRLQSEEEAWNAGVDDLLHSGQLCLVEWPEQAQGLLPPDTWHIFMEIIDPDTRRLYTSDNQG